MSSPVIELIPSKAAVRADGPCTLDVLVRVTPPGGEDKKERPRLNLGLVLDRSGSMGAQNKIGFARQAAEFLVRQLLPSDRLSFTVFDDRIETAFPNGPVEGREVLISLIREIHPRGSTALHGGWQEGAQQVRGNLLAEGLNRVLLLSDGLANVGETNPDRIATAVHEMLRQGVSTTTLGLGDDYNEDLLEAMARSGDGNYHYIEAPEQLEGIFRTELHGLMATLGRQVSLGVEGLVVDARAEVLNEFDVLPTGRYKLPHLVAGIPVLVVLRLHLPAFGGGRICRLRLAWNPPEGARQHFKAELDLPAVSGGAWDSLASDLEVQERSVLLLIARLKKDATRKLQVGDREGARLCLEEAKKLLATLPDSAERRREEKALAVVEEHLVHGAWDKFNKHAKYQARQRHRSEQYRDDQF